MKKTILSILIILSILGCDYKEVEPVYEIDLLEVYSHAQEMVDVVFYVNDYYTYILHPKDYRKISFVKKVNEDLYTIESWVEWRSINKTIRHTTWDSEVRYKNGVFQKATIVFN